jgi:hypothetical protein
VDLTKFILWQNKTRNRNDFNSYFDSYGEQKYDYVSIAKDINKKVYDSKFIFVEGFDTIDYNFHKKKEIKIMETNDYKP